jgi:signal transduction histidine kinase
MKLISMRLCLILILSLIVIVAILSAGGTALILTQGTATAQQRSALIQTMLVNSTHWTDQAWQRTMQAKLTALDMTVVIRNPAGRVLYQSGTYSNFVPVFQEVMITNGTQPLGTAFIYECTSTVLLTLQMLLVGLVALLLSLAGAAWFMSWTFLKPLATIKQAAQQVARDDLDFHFPISKVREVAEAFQAFTTMGEALRASLWRQAEVEQERRLFISAIAHDLRTPLFSLRGYLEGLAVGLANTPEKAAKYIEVCQAKAATLERLITDLFSYTQLEYLEQVPHQEPLDISELITHTLESLQPQAQARDVTLIPGGPSAPCSIVQGDAHLLTRVFENLLDNALRYTPAGGTIRVNWHPEPDRFVFSITDTGPGIAPVDLPHLFTPLYRGDPSRNRQTGGAGLGLTIAQRILRAHGGDLTATNAVNGGAVFTGSLAYKEANFWHNYTSTVERAYAVSQA